MTDEPIKDVPTPTDAKLGREVHIFATERASKPPPSSTNLVALLAAGCTVLGVIVGFSLGMVAGSRAAHTSDCAAAVAPVLAASPRLVALPSAPEHQPGFLGLQFVTYVSDDNGDSVGAGALVTEVFSQTAADRIGFEAGDIITAVDDSPIPSSQALVQAIWSRGIGDSVAVTYWRDGVRNAVVATLGPIPPQHTARFRQWERARSTVSP